MEILLSDIYKKTLNYASELLGPKGKQPNLNKKHVHFMWF